MDHVSNLIRKVLISLLFAAVITACSRDHDDENSAATNIATSEKMFIPPTVELPLNTPNGNTRAATFYAVGVQQYKAKEIPGRFPAEYEWAFVAPRAELFDGSNRKLGVHGAGPFWATTSGDSIFAQQFTPARNAASFDPQSIDWLLLMTKEGTHPKGLFAGVDYIQRIATRGGKAPATKPANPFATLEVPYTAVYRFTRKTP